MSHYDKDKNELEAEIEAARTELKSKLDSLSHVEIRFILKIIPNLKQLIASAKLLKELLKGL